MAVRMTINSDRFNRRVSNFVRQNQATVDRIVLAVAFEVLSDIVEGWPVDEGISRAAWRGPVKGSASGVWRLTNPMPYAAIIEFGGYPGVGPKTVELGASVFPGGINVAGGIFPSQRPHAPVRRSLSKNRDEVTRRIANAIDRHWGR